MTSVLTPASFASLVLDPRSVLERPPPCIEPLRALQARAPLATVLARDDSAPVLLTELSKTKHWEALYECDALIKEKTQEVAVFKGQLGDILAPSWMSDIFAVDGHSHTIG